MVSNGGEWVIGVREMFSDEGYGGDKRYSRKVFPYLLSILFSFLDERKEGKRKSRCQGHLPSLPGTRGGLRSVFRSWPGTGRGGRCVFRGGRQAKKIPAKRLDGGNLRVVANDGMDYVGDSVSGAFRSKMERRM